MITRKKSEIVQPGKTTKLQRVSEMEWLYEIHCEYWYTFGPPVPANFMSGAFETDQAEYL